MTKRFEIIQNIPSPYRLHLFNEMWRQLEERGVEFHVNFMSEGHAERPDSWRHPKIDFPHTYWPDYGWGSHHFNPGLLMSLKKTKPDYLLVGSPFDTFTSILAAWFCDAGVRCTWVEGQTKTPGKMGGFIGWFKRFVLSRYPLVGVPGSDGVGYFELHQKRTSRKMPRAIYLPNLIDETRFKPRSQWPDGILASIRVHFGCRGDERLCLIPARLEPVKGLLEFLDVVDAEVLDGWKIIILGQGSLKEVILAKIKEKDLADKITIFDYADYEQMPAYYAAADLFLLPSRHDPNPLSVVEALHSGLPIALSDRSGNVEEAVADGVNGWRLPVLDRVAFQEKLKVVFGASREQLSQMGHHSLVENSQFWNTTKGVGNFLDEYFGYGRPASVKKSNVAHLLAALGFSLSGLIDAVINESAIRKELVVVALNVLGVALFPCSFVVKLYLCALTAILIAVELLNSAVEEVVDLVSPEWSAFAKRAKDYGSAAVCVILCTWIGSWVTLIANFFFAHHR